MQVCRRLQEQLRLQPKVCRRLREELRPLCKLCGRPGAIFSQQWILGFHNHKAFHLSYASLLKSQVSLHYNMACIISVSIYVYIRRDRGNRDRLSDGGYIAITSSHLISSYHTTSYTLYRSQLLISVPLADIWWIHAIGWILTAG